MNSGAEAVESGLKVARKWGTDVKGVPEGMANIIVADNNFHGRTISIVSFSDDPQYRDGFGPFTPGFRLVPYGDLAALESAIGPNTVGFLVEPIQGEGGIVLPPEGYLRKSAELCRRRQVLFMADEIQTGLARTGKLLACDHEGVKPDVLMLGKALGGGMMPVSAVLASREVLGVFQPGDHGSTFGGNPLGCAVARAAMRILKRDRLAERSASMGEAFMQRLRAMKLPVVREVRGKGLLIGIELHKDAGPAKDYAKRLKNEGMLCKDTVESVLRLAPPLIIDQADLDWAGERIERVLG
jgi:ornithine--oxo-acid transaminase